MGKSLFDVSVIVTTKNEAANIRNCLDSVKKQDFPAERIEIILVDNDSSDSTREIAAEFTRNIFTYGPERSAQRNFGAERAHGEYVLYLDADMALSGSVIKDCVASCYQNGYIALYIPERIIGEGFWIKARDFERSFYNATCIDCVRFVRRENFLKICGFDENLTGPEDWDFDRRIKLEGRVGIIESVLFHNEGKFDFRNYIRKKAYYGDSFDRYIEKWGNNDKIIRRQFGLYYRYFGVFIENGGFLKLLRHPILSFGMYILRFFIGFVYLAKRSGIKWQKKR